MNNHRKQRPTAELLAKARTKAETEEEKGFVSKMERATWSLTDKQFHYLSAIASGETKERRENTAPRLEDGEIDRLKAQFSPALIAERLDLKTTVSGTDRVALCPWHTEKTGSLHLYGDHFFCYGACGTNYSVIDVVIEIKSLDLVQACLWIDPQARLVNPAKPETDQEKAERAEREAERALERQEALIEREAQEGAKKAEMRKNWPPFCDNHIKEALQELADLRGIHYAGPYFALKAGSLRFTVWKNQLAWVIGDSTCAQARRLDGGSWPDIGEAKAWTLPGSETHPIGLTKGSKPVIICEGGPDYLSVWVYLFRQTLHDDFEVVCLLGTSSRLGKYAKRLKGRDVRIIPHRDEDAEKGEAAAKRWAEEAYLAGASSILIEMLPGMGDINDQLVRERGES